MIKVYNENDECSEVREVYKLLKTRHNFSTKDFLF